MVFLSITVNLFPSLNLIRLDNNTKSITHLRRVSYYASPRNNNLVQAYAEIKGMSKSSVIDMAAKNFFDALPESERRLLLRQIGGKNHG